MIATASAAHIPAIVALDGLAARPWSEATWRTHLRARHGLTVVSRDDDSGDVTGFAAFALAGDVADLLRVAVAPEHRRQRLAWSLIDAGIDWAVSLEAARMMLEVEPDNVAAVRLYRELGFRDVSVRRDYYGSGADALVMALSLASIEEWELTGTNQ